MSNCKVFSIIRTDRLRSPKKTPQKPTQKKNPKTKPTQKTPHKKTPTQQNQITEHPGTKFDFSFSG